MSFLRVARVVGGVDIGDGPGTFSVELYDGFAFDEAVSAKGSRVKDPIAFARLINDLLVRTLV
jgi:hypothetical protein